MRTIVPLIAPSSAGPLGVVHLPRLWLKVLLHATGALPEGYRHGSGGFDELVLTSLGVVPEAFVAYLEAERPSYLACEGWVRERATALTPASVAAVNAVVLGRDMPPEAALRTRAAIGLADPSITRGVLLNALDDWAQQHGAVPAQAPAGAAPIVPAISTSVAGPLGANHLPRLWLKGLLKAAGLLPPGYNSGPGGLDGVTLAAFGVPMADSVHYLGAQRPTYLQYEAWVREHATNLTPASIAASNEALRTREKPEERAAPERIEIGIADPSVRGTIVLNDLLDWTALHVQARAHAGVS